MNALLNWKRRGVKWILIVHNAAMFSIVTICTAVNLDVQSISYIDSREFPGIDGMFPSGPIGYQGFIHSKAISFVATIMFILNNWLADGLLVSSVLDPAPRVPNLGCPSSSIIAT